MKYSFCFCYRDREEHLGIVVPRIQEYATTKGLEHEIIVVEQNDTKPFRRGNLLNEAARFATGDILVLHDIDHYPIEGDYWDGASQVYLPIRRVEFRNNDLTPRLLEDIPSGYRHFSKSVDEDYFGGVSTFQRKAFFAINGFNPLFIGWGFEDADLRERIAHGQLTVKRSDNGFFCALNHPDSAPNPNDPALQRNMGLWHDGQKFVTLGVKNQPSKTEEIIPKHPLVTRWILATDFDPPTPQANKIVMSNLGDLDE